ncbi:hypothetical protein SLEP1_g12627 [Rubroshorea leprosula]|uniref:Uncharacterized protein n=1 Tax=Rubroshorea leprosula TaxID=152421 RepID=A0AAV5ID61_9ROSI|nr:hypothetical protein SLEP1_g12627 [Rubroshorea leprosula]
MLGFPTNPARPGWVCPEFTTNLVKNSTQSVEAKDSASWVGFVRNPRAGFLANPGSWVRWELTNWVPHEPRLLGLLGTPELGSSRTQAPGFVGNSRAGFLANPGSWVRWEPASWVPREPRLLGSLGTCDLGSSRTQASGFVGNPQPGFLANPGSWFRLEHPREPRLLGSLGTRDMGSSRTQWDYTLVNRVPANERFITLAMTYGGDVYFVSVLIPVFRDCTGSETEDRETTGSDELEG